LQCVAVCCSVLQCVAVCCSVLQCVAVCCSVSKKPYISIVISSSSALLVKCMALVTNGNSGGKILGGKLVNVFQSVVNGIQKSPTFLLSCYRVALFF